GSYLSSSLSVQFIIAIYGYFLTLGSLVLPALNKESSRASYAGLKLSQYRSIAENSSFLLLRFVELL
ncbi:hypothetical protein, partial [Lactobacillus gallinarum]|uniref:hypothetical protein n=1 Tax=Lactobacillus gallinarum TaxID=52242 RepID=UPI00388D068A